MMRLVLLFTIFACALGATVCQAEQEFPYVGYTRDSDVPVRGGAGREFYVTDLLERGAKVEVYRHDGQWLAIRPPVGSFSWVPAAKLKMTAELGIAETTADGVSSLIGSRTAEVVQHHIQITLDRGELVEVLGVQQKRDDSGAWQTWYKIAPPAGEFRWIEANQIALEPILEPAQETPPSLPDARSTTDNKPDGNDSFQPVQFVAKGTRDRSTQSSNKVTPNNATPKETATSTTPRSFASQLDNIDLELSAIVAQEPSYWKFDDLLQRTETLLESGATALSRSRARLLLSKIAEFERLRRRHDNLGPLPANYTASSVRQPNGLTDAGSFPLRFDGSGWLMPVHSQKRPAPPYALLSDNGKVLQYITPAPGLNLHRYLNQQVAIQGRRGYVSHLETPHLTAQRIKVLDRALR